MGSLIAVVITSTPDIFFFVDHVEIMSLYSSQTTQALSHQNHNIYTLIIQPRTLAYVYIFALPSLFPSHLALTFVPFFGF